MGIQFVLGPSGSGKSTYVQDKLIQGAVKERNRNFFLIVPDQYTMQTQFEMATRHPAGGILNIDVLSFGRLKHSIFEEVGKDSRIPLDDTGKCLIIRKIMEEQKDNLKVLKKGMGNPGCVEEVKSIISEFMQYGVEPKNLDSFMSGETRHLNLVHKLEDIKLLYEAFLQECKEKYLTNEESLTLLCSRLPLSGRFRDAVVVFDGFTGFTPIQLNVIITMGHIVQDLIITLPFDDRYDPYALYPDEFFLHLTQKTVRRVKKRAEDENIPVLKEIWMPKKQIVRFKDSPELGHLEHNLFRKEAAEYPKNCEKIEIVKAGSVEQECRLACEWMFRQIKEEKLRYRDIAVITGNMNDYREMLKKYFTRYDVPYFMDSTVNMLKNPFIQFLRSALNLFLYDFSYRDCMVFLRSGYCDFTKKEVDEFDNYIRAKGIRGANAYRRPFLKPSRELAEKHEEFEQINVIRERFIHIFDRFGHVKGKTEKPAKEWAECFYYFMEDLRLQDKLKEQSDSFKERNDAARGKEFEQLYRYVIELLDQIAGLLGEERITLRVFAEILEAGYGEIRIGILPQGVDVLVVGDMLRTRLNNVKALLFLGVNDGNIPTASKQGGIISDLERDILSRTGMELAPTPAQQIFIERQYLYLTVTKPRERLYLSYASVSEEGKKKTPSYFIKTVKTLFPSLTEHNRAGENPLLSVKDEKEQFTRLLSLYASGVNIDGESVDKLKAFYGDFLNRKDLGDWPKEMVEHAFAEYLPEELKKELAKELYGQQLRCSASSLRLYAQCQYSHFLAYGLHLSEREEAGFERREFGSLNHEFLDRVSRGLQQAGIVLNDVTKEELDAQIEKVLDEFKEEDQWDLFRENAGGDYFAEQARRLMNRTFMTIGKQLGRGEFKPQYFEIPFQTVLSCKESGNKVLLNGRIDRIDLCEDDGKLYVKVVDYKSGKKEFREDQFEMGMELQLAIYLKQAVEKIKEKYPKLDVIPAAMFYYHIIDPFIEIEGNMEADDIEKARMKELNHSGILTNDLHVVDLMDKELSDTSVVIPASVKNGVVKGSKTKDSDYLKAMLQYAEDKVIAFADEIYQGKKAINPVTISQDQDSCTYCNFRDICPYDDKIKGYCKRRMEPVKGILPKEGDEE